jgi:hypothetical protein
MWRVVRATDNSLAFPISHGSDKWRSDVGSEGTRTWRLSAGPALTKHSDGKLWIFLRDSYGYLVAANSSPATTVWSSTPRSGAAGRQYSWGRLQSRGPRRATRTCRASDGFPHATDHPRPRPAPAPGDSERMNPVRPPGRWPHRRDRLPDAYRAIAGSSPTAPSPRFTAPGRQLVRRPAAVDHN